MHFFVNYKQKSRKSSYPLSKSSISLKLVPHINGLCTSSKKLGTGLYANPVPNHFGGPNFVLSYASASLLNLKMSVR